MRVVLNLYSMYYFYEIYAFLWNLCFYEIYAFLLNVYLFMKYSLFVRQIKTLVWTALFMNSLCNTKREPEITSNLNECDTNNGLSSILQLIQLYRFLLYWPAGNVIRYDFSFSISNRLVRLYNIYNNKLFYSHACLYCVWIGAVLLNKW